ncbi:hypothetical protein AAFN47_12550 [Hoeflea sp. CAU 1731]
MASEDGASIRAIDIIYEILDELEEDVRKLQADRRKSVEVYNYNGISEAVQFLDELGFSNRFGLSGTDLYKFHRLNGTVNISVLRQLASRLMTLMREAEGTIRSIADTSRKTLAPEDSSSSDPPEKALQVVAIEWVRNDRAQNAELIAELTELLDEAVSRASNTNLPPDKAAFTEFQRKALIDLLETALQMLKAPLVEKGLLKRLGNAAEEGANTAVKKGAEIGLGLALKRVLELLTRFTDLL